jgi:hypothetical protein
MNADQPRGEHGLRDDGQRTKDFGAWFSAFDDQQVRMLVFVKRCGNPKAVGECEAAFLFAVEHRRKGLWGGRAT